MTNQTTNIYTEDVSDINYTAANNQEIQINTNSKSPLVSALTPPAPSSTTSGTEKLTNILVFPPAMSSQSTFSSLFSSPNILNSAIMSTTALLTFPISMDLKPESNTTDEARLSEIATSDGNIQNENIISINRRKNFDDENLSLPICLVSSPSPPPERTTKFPLIQSPPIDAAQSSQPIKTPQIRSSSLSSSSTTLSSSSSPSLISIIPNITSIPCSSPLSKHNSLSPSLSCQPKEVGYAQRKMLGKKLSVAINPVMNRLMDGCHTVGVVGPLRDKQSASHKRESILHKSDLLMKDMSPSIRSSLGSFSDGIQDEAIITPYAQLLNSLRSIRNNYFVVANLSPIRSRRLSGYEAQKIFKSSQITDDMKHKMVLETLEEIEFCLDKLENMQTHPSAAQMAAHKFRQILNQEMSLNPELKTGGSITGYLKTFIEESGNEEELQNKNNNFKNKELVTSRSANSNLVLENGNEFEKHKKEEESQTDLNSFLSNVDAKLENMIRSTADTWGVDLFELSLLSNNRPLTHVALHLFKHRNLFKTFSIPERTFFKYISLIEENYHTDNPYHNNIHATDVLQAVHHMLNFDVFKGIFTELEIFSALFAAAVHDVDHPGVTNHFLICTSSELALLYNDESVLENHHVAFAFKLLKKKECDVTSSFGRKERQMFRKMVISMVLATDMSKHMQHVAHLKTMVEVKRLSSSSSSSSSSNILNLLLTKVVDPDNNEEKMQVLQTMVHCSDLSNPLKPLEVYWKWTGRIMEEFFRQGDKEKELGLEISPLCDRDSSDIYKSQIGFIDYVVHPLWETWGALTQPDCQHILDHLENNRVWLTSQDLATSKDCDNEGDYDDGDDDHDHDHDRDVADEHDGDDDDDLKK